MWDLPRFFRPGYADEMREHTKMKEKGRLVYFSQGACQMPSISPWWCLLYLQLFRVATKMGLRLLARWDCGFESHRWAWMFIACECFVLSGRGLCVGLITRPTECGVSECDRKVSIMRRPWPTRGCWAMGRGGHEVPVHANHKLSVCSLPFSAQILIFRPCSSRHLAYWQLEVTGAFLDSCS
jgi:hypothetical protein